MKVVEKGNIIFYIDTSTRIAKIYAKTKLQTFKLVWVNPQSQQPSRMKMIADLISSGEVSSWDDLIKLTIYEDKNGVSEQRITLKDVSAWGVKI